MPLLQPKSACSQEIPQAGEDFRQAARAAQFRVGELAFYFPAFPGTRYIPFESLTRAVAWKGSLPTTGCCGKEMPVMKLVLEYAGERKAFIVDPPRHMDTILDHIHRARPELEVVDRR